MSMIGSCIFTRMRQCVLVVAHTQSIYYIAGLVSSAADTTRAPADSRIARMLTRVAWGPAFKVPACELARSAARLGLKVGPFFARSSPTTATPQCPLLDVTSLLTPTLPKLLRARPSTTSRRVIFRSLHATWHATHRRTRQRKDQGGL